MTEKDFSLALEKAGQINQYNETRKDLDKTMTEEANQIVAELEGLADRRSIVLYNEDWHKGVIGIVASRLTEVYYRPAVVLTRTDDMATGSARPLVPVLMYTKPSNIAICWRISVVTYAAGLSMKVENAPAFTERFEEFVHSIPAGTNQRRNRHQRRNRLPGYYAQILQRFKSSTRLVPTTPNLSSVP